MEDPLIINIETKSGMDYELEFKKNGNFIRILVINKILQFKYKREINFDSELKKKYFSIENFFGKIINYYQRNEIFIDDSNIKNTSIELKIKNLRIPLKMIEKDDEDNNEKNNFINKKKLNKDNNEINNKNNNNNNNKNQINNNNNNDNFIKEIDKKYFMLLKKINDNNESNLKKLNDYIINI